MKYISVSVDETIALAVKLKKIIMLIIAKVKNFYSYNNIVLINIMNDFCR
jgi:hypothetical protein